MGLGKNSTRANLRQNPHAVYVIMVPGATITDWRGIWVYLKVLSIATSRSLFFICLEVYPFPIEFFKIK